MRREENGSSFLCYRHPQFHCCCCLWQTLQLLEQACEYDGFTTCTFINEAGAFSWQLEWLVTTSVWFSKLIQLSARSSFSFVVYPSGIFIFQGLIIMVDYSIILNITFYSAPWSHWYFTSPTPNDIPDEKVLGEEWRNWWSRIWDDQQPYNFINFVNECRCSNFMCM